MTTTPAVTCAFDPGNYLGETPLWSADEQALYWVNCEQPPQVHRWQPRTGAHDVWPMPARVGGIVLAPGARLLVVLADGIYDFNPADVALNRRVSSPLPDHVALHETQCDRQGRLWVGAYDHHFTADNRDARGGAIFRLDGDRLTPVIPEISVANGMAFSPDGRTLYVSDSPTRTVDAYDLDPATGEIANRRAFLSLGDGEGFVDGATVDAEGGYWLAAVSAGTVRRYLPDGSLERVVRIPASNPTKPAFGGPDLATLYVTTTRLKIGPDCDANGAVYAFEPGVTGVAEPLFAG